MGYSRREDGFSMLEVMVAASILLMGILAVASTVIAANRSTAGSGARTAATSLARQIIETARITPSSQLTPTGAQTALMAALPALPDAALAVAGWQISRSGLNFTVTVTVCNDDDPVDGTGAHDGTYCANPAVTTPADGQPADFRRVTVAMTWKDGKTSKAVSQVGRIPVGSSDGGGATDAPPAPGQVTMTSPFNCSTTCPQTTNVNTTSLSFAATMGSAPAGVEWLADENRAAACPPVTTTCSGSGVNWGFVWNIGTPVRDMNSSSINYGMCTPGAYLYDGVHTVGVRGYDAAGRVGDANSIPVPINRCAPIAPAGFDATGRDSSTAVDVEWEASPEGDVIGYRVYRATSANQRTPVCPAVINAGQVIALDDARECTDPSPPNYSKNSDLYYGVYAVDRDEAGNIREGAVSYIDVNTGNKAPSAPANFAISASGAITLTWTLPASQDPDSGDTIESFRIYRRAGTVSGQPTYLDRIDRENKATLCSGSTCSYTDTAALGTTATYWISSVDTHVRQSTIVGPKTR